MDYIYAAPTKEQIAAFLDHLERVGGRETCPLCDANMWGYLFLERKLFVTDLDIPPFLARTCRHCAYVMLFDARVSGYTANVLVEGVLYPSPVSPSWPPDA